MRWKALVVVGAATVASSGGSDERFGAAYVAVGPASLQAVARSVRTLRQAGNDVGCFVATDAAGARWTETEAPGFFDVVIQETSFARTLLAALQVFDGVVLFREATAVCGRLPSSEEAYWSAGKEDDKPALIVSRNSTETRRRLAKAIASESRRRRLSFRALAEKAAAQQSRVCLGGEQQQFSAAPPNVRALPNRFLSSSLSSEYVSAPAVFVHLPKASGNSVKQFFVKDRLARHRRSRPQSLHIDTRRDWDVKTRRRRRQQQENGRQRESGVAALAVAYGAFAFDACFVRPCAYYVVFRDPVARVVSEFTYCRETVAYRDQCCTGLFGVAYARRALTTLADWAEHKGNFVLEHFLGFSDPDWRPLEHATKRNASSHFYVRWRERDFEARVNPLETRRRREGPANEADLAVALRRLESWFAVVGLTERYEESVALFSWVLTGTVVSHADARSVHTHNQKRVRASSPSLPPAVLHRVRSALALDIRLYEAAATLFDRQVAAFHRLGGHFILDDDS